MAGRQESSSQRSLVKVAISIGGIQFREITVKEIILAESLLTPGLQTAVTIQSFIHGDEIKNFDQYKGQTMTISMGSEIYTGVVLSQTLYRIDNRMLIPNNMSTVEELTLHACDPTLLEDSRKMMSKSWKCKSPGQIVNEALDCVGSTSRDNSENPQPNKDYIAENIHPFQVISQQSNVSYVNGDPSFIHYMTYNMGGQPQGMHHFRSLYSLSRGGVKKKYITYESGVAGNQDYNLWGQWPGSSGIQTDIAVAFSFPCDFDLLSDTLNGLAGPGNTLATFNPVTGETTSPGINPCGLGSNFKMSMTNKGSAEKQNSCETDVESYLPKRQARMALLEKDKIALRLVGAWDPNLHVGDVIEFEWKHKYNQSKLYGSGNYLVSGLIHNIQLGGFSTTTIECVSTTVGQGGIV